MTREVDASDQGQLQGANNSISGLTSIVGPLMFAFVFAEFIRPTVSANLAGAPFFLATSLMLAAAALAVFVARRNVEKPPSVR